MTIRKRPLGAAAIGDQVGDGADLQAMELGEGHEVRQPRHGAVVLHDLADHAGRVQARHAADVDRGLRMACADQDAAVLGDQGEDVARRNHIVGILRGIYRDRDGVGPVVGGDAGGDPLAGLDGDGERRAVARLVVGGHRRQAQLARAVGGDRQADQAAGVLGHEVDLLGRGELGRDDDVALVLPVLGVHQDVGPPVAGVLDDVLDRADGRGRGLRIGRGDEVGSFHRAASRVVVRM
jgi:hypothetical protein